MLAAPAILPPTHRYRVLMPVRQAEWREPSLAQPKDQFGNQNRTRFRLAARLHDGHVRWQGWFDSREDADAFLHALGRHVALGEPMPRPLWELPTPAWHPDIGPHVTYDFARLDFLTTTSASNQTYSVPGDFTPGDNEVHVISHGASGGNDSSFVGGVGSAGGGYAHATNVSLTPGGSAPFRLRAGNSGSGDANASWFNGTSLAASSAGIRGAPGGAAIGGTTNAVGDLVYSGGMGGSPGFGSPVGGAGGGAAGPHGAGGAAANTGSYGDIGGTGDAGNTPSNTAGTQFDEDHGSGGGANAPAANNSAGLNAPQYGGGASGASGNTNGTHHGGLGGQGLIVVRYTPVAAGAPSFNMPLLGI